MIFISKIKRIFWIFFSFLFLVHPVLCSLQSNDKWCFVLIGLMQFYKSYSIPTWQPWYLKTAFELHFIEEGDVVTHIIWFLWFYLKEGGRVRLHRASKFTFRAGIYTIWLRAPLMGKKGGHFVKNPPPLGPCINFTIEIDDAGSGWTYTKQGPPLIYKTPKLCSFCGEFVIDSNWQK